MGNNECCGQILSEITDDFRSHHGSPKLLQTAKPLVASKRNVDYSPVMQNNIKSVAPSDGGQINSFINDKPKKRFESLHKLRVGNEELSDIQIQFKQQIHEMEILNQQYHALRQENSDLKSLPNHKNSDDIYPEISLTSDVPQRLSPLVDPLPPMVADDLYSFSDVITLSPSLPLDDIKEEDVFMFKKGVETADETCILSTCNESCLSVKRIIKALEWYALFMNDEDSFLKQLNEYEYDDTLLSDWKHILSFHSQTSPTSNYTFVEMVDTTCDVVQCNGFKRYTSEDNGTNRVMDTMDWIHCYFMHLD